VSRLETLERFALLAKSKGSEDAYNDVLLIFNGWPLRPVNREILEPLVSKLQLICGPWAGYDHSALLAVVHFCSGIDNKSLTQSTWITSHPTAYSTPMRLNPSQNRQHLQLQC
jgi:hypothetical protein